MPQMSIKEKLAISMKCIELEKEGKFEEAERLHKQIPVPPYMVEWAKKYIGLDFLIKQGYNLSEAEEKFGHEWFAKTDAEAEFGHVWDTK